MVTREQLIEMSKKESKICLTTSCTLPSGAVETITNYHNLDEKIEYLLNAYDEKLHLKTMKDIKLVGCMLVCKEDLKN